MIDTQTFLNEYNLQDVQKELAEKSMYEFIKQAWNTIEPGRQFYDNWHIQAICEHLEAILSGDVTRLLINIPPRHMKSLTCNVAFCLLLILQL